MKRILVKGGAGFPSYHLCEDLLKKGNEVICLDNYFTGKMEKIIHLMDPYFELVRHDVTMLELANEIIDITMSRSKIVHLSLPEDDPTQRQPEIFCLPGKNRGAGSQWYPCVKD
jgi:UDP-glucose 4-epimerase